MTSKMRLLFWLSILFILGMALIITSPVYAGGWVVITLDQLPGNITAGQPYVLGFVARQHGQTYFKVDQMRIEAKQTQTGKTATFIAKPDGQPGHYQAELLFTEVGRWEWGIQSGLYPTQQPMPAIEVTGAASTVAPSRQNLPTPLFGSLTLLSFIGGLALIGQSRGKILLRLAGGGLLVLSCLLIFAFFSSVKVEAGKNQPAQAVTAERDTGQQLFLAKGCVVCHVNNRAIADPEMYSVNIGPNLSAYHNDASYLRQFLAHPTGPETNFPMPNLNLSSAEIDALVSFINASPAR